MPDTLDISGWTEAEVYDLLRAVVEQANTDFSSGDPNRAFDDTPGHVNLVGVRGFKDGSPTSSNRNDRYDDTMFVLSVSASGVKTAESFELSTEFGNVDGYKSLAQVGQHRYWLYFHKLSRTRVDISRHSTYPGGQYRALKPHPEGVRTILDWNQNLVLDAGTRERYNNDPLINIHYGGENRPSNWSAGCQILRGWENYRRFIRLVESDHSIRGTDLNQLAPRPARGGTRFVVYTLVEGSYVEDVWRRGDYGSSPRVAGAGLPLDLGAGRALSDAALEAAYDHVERGHHGGWYPVSENTLWHGGIHLSPGETAPSRTVHACLPGTVVAARLGSGDAAQGPFGSRNFVLVRHEMMPGARPVEDDPSGLPPWLTPAPLPPTVAAPPPEREPGVYFSLYMHLAPMSADGTGVDGGTADVPWLQRPEVFEVVTGRNYRRAPRTAGNDPIGLAPPGTRFETAPNPPEPEAGRFRWGRVLLPSGPVDAFMSVTPSSMRQVQAGGLDTELADRFCGGEVIAVERSVQAGDVLWEVGTHGLRGPTDLPPGHAPPLPEVLHWEVFSERNLLADLCRDPGLEVAAPSGDGQAGPPPVPRPPSRSSRSVLVTSATGPETVEVGRPATFRVTQFSVPATPDDRARVNWEVRIDGAAVQRFEAAGDQLVYTPLPAHAGTTLTAHPFINSQRTTSPPGRASRRSPRGGPPRTPTPISRPTRPASSTCSSGSTRRSSGRTSWPSA